MWFVLAAAVAQNCLHDYLLQREESCYFGSESSRIALLAEVETLLTSCDLKTCSCSAPQLKGGDETCEAFAVQAMLGFSTVHGETDETTAEIYRNITSALEKTCMSNQNENEPSPYDAAAHFGGCGPTRLPGAGHNAGIVAYVSIIAGLATFVYLYSDQALPTPNFDAPISVMPIKPKKSSTLQL